MGAELSPAEAAEQLELWTTKLAEALAEVDRYKRLADGYSRMIEGLRLIHPEIGVEPDAVTTTEGHARPPFGAVVAERDRRPSMLEKFKSMMEEKPEPIRVEDAVLAVLDSRDHAAWTTKAIAAEIGNQGWRLDSTDWETTIRKFLYRAGRDGRIVSTNIDGRTKGYRLPDKTPGDDASTSSPGTVTTERPGGDGHAAGPDSVSDHGEAFSGRNTRDHDRETATQ